MSAQQHVSVLKTVKEDKRIAYAEVYTPDVPDSDGEFMRAPEIEKAAHAFMRAMKLDSIDHEHQQTNVEGCCVVESFIARKNDPDFNEGAWVVGVHIDNDDMWDKVKKGEVNGFSMEAWVQKTKIEVEMDMPPVLAGKTMKSESSDDDHEHDFMVAYDDKGTFLGGRTSEAGDPPHVHIIKRGTITEKSEGHAHRFAHVNQLKIK